VLFGALTMTASVTTTTAGGSTTQSNPAGALIFLVPYGIALLGLIIGGRHFSRGG
jgi:hypothetical protein